MSSSSSQELAKIEVIGTVGKLSQISGDCPVKILKKSTSSGFDGNTVLHLVFGVDWSTFRSALEINLLSAWLFGQFSRSHADQHSDPEPITITIKTGEGTTDVVVSRPEDIEVVLQEAVPDAPETDDPEE